MSGLNKIQLIGRLGKDPELAYTQDGLGILKFTLATSEIYNDKNGERVENTTWHNVVLFGKMAETLANYLTKGKQVYVEGKIRNSSYDDKEGIKRYKTEVISNNVILLGKKDDTQGGQDEEYDEKPPQAQTQRQASGAAQRSQTQSGQKYQGPPPNDDNGDDIPF